MSVQKTILTFFKRDPTLPMKKSLDSVMNPCKKFKSSQCDKTSESNTATSALESNNIDSEQHNELTCVTSNKDDSNEINNQNKSNILTGDDYVGPGLRAFEENRIEKNRLTAKLKLLSSKFKLIDPQMNLQWFSALENEFTKPYFKALNEFVTEQRRRKLIFPPEDQVWSWTKFCELKDVKVVIIGQDPYHGIGQAHGLCFSVPVGVKIPPSLVNIFKELEKNYDSFETPYHGYLMGWAMQGVLLLNAVLTVEAGKANSHKDRGWETLTTAVIKYLNDNHTGLVFMLWGNYAQEKAKFVNETKHHVLKAGHPSPMSVNRFFGCRHFMKCNKLLKEDGRIMINWLWLPTAEDKTGEKSRIEYLGTRSIESRQVSMLSMFKEERVQEYIQDYKDYL